MQSFIFVLRITETGAVVYILKKSILVALGFVLGVLSGDQIPQSAETYDRGHKHGGVFSHGMQRVPSTDHDGHHGTGGGYLREIGAPSEESVSADRLSNANAEKRKEYREKNTEY